MPSKAFASAMSHVIVAGGTESMSNAPYLLKGARWGYRMGNAEAIDSMLSEGLTCAINACHMGITAEEVAQPLQHLAGRSGRVLRREPASRGRGDRRRRASRRKSCRSTFRRRKATRFGSTPTNIRVPERRSKSSRALKPAFKKGGSVTAGNASGINDGAAALVVMNHETARQRGVQPLARVLAYASTGVDPMVMGIGPISAVRKVLERAGLQASAIDLFELNEAFAAQSLAVVRELGVDPAKVNVNGGAIALGHPIGASGARILTTLMYALQGATSPLRRRVALHRRRNGDRDGGRSAVGTPRDDDCFGGRRRGRRACEGMPTARVLRRAARKSGRDY